MNRIALLLASLCAAGTVLLAGCPLGCGGYSGNGDRVLASGTDQLILCENGGFVATTSAGTTEGMIVVGTTGTVGIEGDDGAQLFTLVDEGTQVTTAGFGSDDSWDEVDENEVQLDHADVLCTDLTSRGWWSAAQ
ncbi:MAG TPA: hypothetical protein VGL61_01720 [Kofleriaceae bacterium]|jgi:hypothetical protein